MELPCTRFFLDGFLNDVDVTIIKRITGMNPHIFENRYKIYEDSTINVHWEWELNSIIKNIYNDFMSSKRTIVACSVWATANKLKDGLNTLGLKNCRIYTGDDYQIIDDKIMR
jgi:hypothetical protein